MQGDLVGFVLWFRCLSTHLKFHVAVSLVNPFKALCVCLNVVVVSGLVKDVVQRCLGELGLGLGSGGCGLLVGDCGSVGGLRGVPGVYILVDGGVVLYVGEAGDVARRVGGEHCKARIGASEGVTRLLMYLLGEVCMRSDEWVRLNVVDRERFIVNRILKPTINKLTIITVTCPQLKNPKTRSRNRERLKLEKCLINELKPTLQYTPRKP